MVRPGLVPNQFAFLKLYKTEQRAAQHIPRMGGGESDRSTTGLRTGLAGAHLVVHLVELFRTRSGSKLFCRIPESPLSRRRQLPGLKNLGDIDPPRVWTPLGALVAP